jgi:hypothetical protein
MRRSVRIQVQGEFTPKGAKDQVAMMKHPRDQDVKIGFYTRRPYLHRGDDDANYPHMKGQKVKMSRKATRSKMDRSGPWGPDP